MGTNVENRIWNFDLSGVYGVQMSKILDLVPWLACFNDNVVDFWLNEGYRCQKLSSAENKMDFFLQICAIYGPKM